MEKHEVAHRLDLLAKKFNLDNDLLARAFGYSDAKSYSVAKHHGRILKHEQIDVLVTLLPEINLNWLFSGKGDILLSESRPDNYMLNEPQEAYGKITALDNIARRIEEKLEMLYHEVREIREEVRRKN